MVGVGGLDVADDGLDAFGRQLRARRPVEEDGRQPVLRPGQGREVRADRLDVEPLARDRCRHDGIDGTRPRRATIRRLAMITAPMSTSLRVPTLAGHDFNLPPGLEGLGELAYNLWWSWTPRAGSLFSRINPPPGPGSRNPIPVLSAVEPAPLGGAHRRRGLHGRRQPAARRVPSLPGERRRLVVPAPDRRATRTTRSPGRSPTSAPSTASTSRCRSTPAASASWPGTTSSRRQTRRCRSSGWGSSTAAATSASRSMPMATRSMPSRTSTRRSCRCAGRAAPTAPRSRSSIDFPDRQVRAVVWVAQVGRVPLLLLDTDNAGNDVGDWPITHILYVRGREMRLSQELVLGVGGVRALAGLGIEPAVWHLNEGHSAFLLLERARKLMATRNDLPPEAALREVGRNAVFTIHTPVPAGNEVFERPLITKNLAPWLTATGMGAEQLLELGRGRTDDPAAPFDMTAFVLRHAADANAVSKLHARHRHRDLAAGGGAPHRGDHQRRPRGDLARTPGSRPLQARDRQLPRGRRIGPRGVRGPGAALRCRPVGIARPAEAGAARFRQAPTRAPVRAAWRAAGRAARDPWRHEPGCADDRLRAALRHLQARRPHLPRRGAPGQPAGATRIDRCRS